MKENKSRYVILGFLAHEPMSGYDMMKRIRVSVGQFCDISYGQIYPELAKLVQLGLASLDEVGQRAGRTRKIYSITEDGRTELAKWLEAPVRDEKLRFDILLKLFFGSGASPGLAAAAVREFRSRCDSRLTELKRFETELVRIAGGAPDHANYLAVAQFGRMVHETFVEWAELTLERLDKAPSNKESENE